VVEPIRQGELRTLITLGQLNGITVETLQQWHICMTLPWNIIFLRTGEVSGFGAHCTALSFENSLPCLSKAIYEHSKGVRETFPTAPDSYREFVYARDDSCRGFHIVAKPDSFQR